jgi:hypothetical protein
MSEPLVVLNGYRLPEGTDLIVLAETLRTLFAPIRDTLEIQQVAGHAARIINEADIEGTERRQAVIFDAVQAHYEHVSKIVSGEHDCALTTANIAVSDDPETGRLYMLVFHRYREYAEAIDDAELAEYFPYFDEEAAGMNRPAGISKKAWDDRGAVWKRVLRGAPAGDPDGMFRIALGRTLPDMDMVMRAGEVLAAIPDLEVRAIAAVEDFANGQQFASMGELMEFQAALPAKLESIRASLRPITIEDLVGGSL